MVEMLRVLNDSEIDAVSGGRINLANNPGYHEPKVQSGGTVGQGDTIALGAHPGDGFLGTVNNNLSGQGPWGNCKVRGSCRLWGEK